MALHKESSSLYRTLQLVSDSNGPKIKSEDIKFVKRKDAVTWISRFLNDSKPLIPLIPLKDEPCRTFVPEQISRIIESRIENLGLDHLKELETILDVKTQASKSGGAFTLEIFSSYILQRLYDTKNESGFLAVAEYIGDSASKLSLSALERIVNQFMEANHKGFHMMVECIEKVDPNFLTSCKPQTLDKMAYLHAVNGDLANSKSIIDILVSQNFSPSIRTLNEFFRKLASVSKRDLMLALMSSFRPIFLTNMSSEMVFQCIDIVESETEFNSLLNYVDGLENASQLYRECQFELVHKFKELKVDNTIMGNRNLENSARFTSLLNRLHQRVPVPDEKTSLAILNQHASLNNSPAVFKCLQSVKVTPELVGDLVNQFEKNPSPAAVCLIEYLKTV